MWHSYAWIDGGRYLIMGSNKCCLLIGNTRWHWAKNIEESWSFMHTDPKESYLKVVKETILLWAAVGPIQNALKDYLHPANELILEHIPIKNMPPWLGIDRALGAWGALRKAKVSYTKFKGLLIADAGTVLSITKINSKGEFTGGQLVGGLQLQLSSMANGAQYLNETSLYPINSEPFPFATSDAMRKGSINALIGFLKEAQQLTGYPIWICGGDAPVLLKAIEGKGIEIIHHPNLVLEGMVNILERISQAN